MTRTAVLHLGDQQAGSKTLQRFLAENRAALQAHGARRAKSFLYGAYHSGLTAAAMDADRPRAIELREWALTAADPIEREQAQAAHRARMARKLAKEIEGLPEAVSTVVFSHEGLLMLRPGEVARVAELLTPHFDRFVLIAYLRRQDRSAVSAHNARLRIGHATPQPLALITRPPKLRDYATALETWADAFGAASVRPRLFHRDDFIGGELIPDFLEAAELGRASAYESVRAQNEGLAPTAQTLLAGLNPHLSHATEPGGEAHRNLLLTLLSEIASGQGLMPSQAGARWHVRRHAKINEAVRARWFPERETLFDDDFTDYPPIADRTPRFRTTAPLIASLVGLYGERLKRAQMETAMARAELARAQDRRADARAAFERAAGLVRHDATPLLAAARAELAWGAFDLAEAALETAREREPENEKIDEIAGRVARRRREAERAAGQGDESVPGAEAGEDGSGEAAEG